MKLTVLGAEDLRQALPMGEAVEAMKRAFADFSSGRAAVPQRLSVPVADGGGTLLVKTAYQHAGGLGAKLVSVFPENPALGMAAVQGLVVLVDPATGEPRALCDGTFATAWRTGAASGAATDLLARGDARTAALFGCGAQARTQALAIDCVRELETIRVYARTRSAVSRFAREMQPQLSAKLVAVADPQAAVRGADVVCAATNSPTPIFDGDDLEPGAHVNGVGSFTLGMCELDNRTVSRSRIFVDSRDAALAEAGELVAASRGGHTRPESWTELGEVASGIRPGRTFYDDVTLFKSVGLAVQDIAACALAVERAEGLGVGRSLEL